MVAVKNLLVLATVLVLACVASAFQVSSSAKWMEQSSVYISSKRLTEVILPGTHDSGTNNLDIDDGLAADTDVAGWIRSVSSFPFVGAVVNIWSKAQTRGILQQLNDGVRYIDLRFCGQGNNVRTCHGLLGTSLDQVVSEVATFVQQNPREIIILDVQHVSGFMPTHHTQTLNMFEAKLGNKLVLNTRGVNAYINDLWNAGESVYLLYTVDSSSSVFLNGRTRVYNRGGSIVSSWPNKSNVNDLITYLDTSSDGINSRSNNQNQIFVSQGMMTPDGNYIKGMYKDLLKPTTPDCPAGKSSKEAGLCYTPCKSGFHGLATICWNDRGSYGRGVGSVPDWQGNCGGSTPEKQAGLCYKRCDSGFNGVGPVCWANEVSYDRGIGAIPNSCPSTHKGVLGVCWFDPSRLAVPNTSYPNSLEAMGMVANPRVLSWAQGAKNRGAKLNVIIFDVYQNSNTPSAVWSMNFY